MPEADDLFGRNFSIADALLRLRERLLDLTTRNRLLFFRWTRGRVVRVVHTGLDDLYGHLKDEGSLLFRPVPEPRREDYETVGSGRRKPEAAQFAEKQGIDTSYELPPRREGALRHIQTLLYPEDLERVLRNIDRAARTAIEESGTNMLYLVFGFLEWYENDAVQEPRYAPLITMPVMLKRIRHNHTFLYEVARSGEDIADNLTLREKLKQDFSLDLPHFDEEVDPSAYFAEVAQLARAKVEPPWRVSWQVSLGLLSFGNLLMYLDLDPARWPGGKAIDQNKLVKSLFEGTDGEGKVDGEPAEYPVEEDPRATRLPLVFDADSSQHSALVDAMEGKNLVVEGPPGTGKSQTISNLIAAALTRGKTALFISEKLAALEVVRHRLDLAGLGNFCLELHSNKTQKKKLLEDIYSRLQAQGAFPKPQELDAKRRELETRRLRLKQYADLMNSVVHNELELTVHQVLWAAERPRRRLGEKAALLSAEEYPLARTCTYEERERLKEVVGQFEEHCAVIGVNPQAHAWYGYYPYKLIMGDEPAVMQVIRQLAQSADDLGAEYMRAQGGLGFELPPARPAFTELKGQVGSLPSPSGTEALDLLPGICAEEAIDVVRVLEGQVRYVKERMPELLQMLSSPESLGHPDLEVVKDVLAKAGSLNVADTPLPDIQRRGRALLSLATEVRHACAFFSQVAGRLGMDLVPTRQGLAILWAAVRTARLAPLELLAHRRPQLAEPTAATTIETAAKRASILRQTRKMVEALFDMSLVPSRDEAAGALRAVRTSGGLLRAFRAEWRKAARTYRSISLKRHWVLRVERCEGDLRTLVSYLDSKGQFDRDPQLRRLLGDLFQGMDTDFDAVKRLVQWYAQARKAFEGVTGVLDLTKFLELPADAIGWLASVAQECERYWGVVETLRERAQEAFGETGTPPALGTEGATLSMMGDALQTAAETLDWTGDALASYLAAPASPRRLVALVEGAISVASVRAEIERGERTRAILRRHFRGLDTNFALINAVIQWGRAIRSAGLPEKIGTWLLCPEGATHLLGLRSELESLEAKWRAVEGAVRAFDRFGALEWEAWQQGYSLEAHGISDRARRALDGFDGLWMWAGFSRARRRMDELELTPITGLVLAGKLAGPEIGAAFGYLFYNSIARSILRDNPTLIEFSGISHENLRETYAQLDREVIGLNGKYCAHTVDQRAKTAPKGVGSGSPKTYTEMALIAHEVQKQRGHVPIRQLVNRAGRALQALKPCFMMGPLSVAQYLEPGKLHFDMIIMDEASQLRPEEAIGALARGGQMVIVGDPKQLPPTSFFDRFWEGSDGEENREETAVGGMQSILDIGLARFYPARTLRWHYRSQHEALIHFSNHHFYDRRLIIFPSPYGAQAGLGLRHHYVSKGLYENRRNIEEAKRVADAVIQHFLNHHDESLGVATLNIPQRDLIEEEIDRRLRLNPEAEQYIEKWKSQGLMPFFVKNLENVQGDERDVIFISTTYGRNREGVVAQRFGPINQADGWRRLNVLFTRARRRVELFTSMQPSDVIVDAKSRRGVRALRDYLAYVREGIIEGPREGAKPPDSDFEVAVADVLRNQGYDVVPQLGVAGFYIDIAVKNPSRPGEFIAAIECDGAMYHSARSVRDRDRIRQEILEGRGWKDRIYRIWSTDWFRDPNTQIKRLLAFVESAWERAEAKAKAQAERQPTEMPLLPLAEETSEAETFCVRVGDWVTYYDPKYPEDRKRVRIVDGASDPPRNVVGSHTPLAKALLGAGIGDEVELIVEGQPPRMLKILDID
jgi:transcription elongation GreA/GreB family factor